PSVEPWRVGAAQAHLSHGDPLKARQMLAEQLALARPGHARTRGSSLPVQAATDDLQTRSALLSESAELLRLCGDRFGLSHALHDLSDTHRLLVGHDRAGGSAHQAHVLALQCRTGALEEALVLHTGDGRSREPGIGLPGRLSDAEWRVAALAADGHTNRAISTQLCVTVSTVEQHLTKIYRKLNVKRFDLKSVLGPTIQAQ
ncbi:MAG: LuxR C-terminal-related transcriptional regulator, partial [Streptosporangiaceae bacterium]